MTRINRTRNTGSVEHLTTSIKQVAVSMKLECERLMKLARGSTLSVLFAAVILTIGCSTSTPSAFAALDVDLAATASAHPDDDAVILAWDQSWTIHEDGSISRRDHQFVLILDVRAIDVFADPRIDYNADYDTVVFHTAQTHLPDGTIMPVPDYSFNLASPGDVGGWPEYAAWRQDIISFSGIVAGCVLELDYEIVSTPLPVLGASADLRLIQPYPTLNRSVTVTCPASMNLAWASEVEPGVNESTSAKTYAWGFKHLPASWDEPQAPHWRERDGGGGRLAFTTCTDAAAWVWPILDAVKNAQSTNDPALRKFVEKAIAEADTQEAKIDAVVSAINASFTHLDSYKTMHALRCRTAAELFQANYGNPIESGALLVSALNIAGFEVQPAVAVTDNAWNDAAPVDSAFSAVVAVIKNDAGVQYVHPRLGAFATPGALGGHTLLALDASGELQHIPCLDPGDTGENTIVVAGSLVMDDKGAVAGELRIALSGAFFDAEQMTDGAAQASALNRVVRDLLPDCARTDHTIVKLNDASVVAMVRVKADTLPTMSGERTMLSLGEHCLYNRAIPIPLNRSTRTTELELRAPFTERVDLTIELPDGAQFTTTPQSMNSAASAWGVASQHAVVRDQSLHLTREVTLNADRVAPGEYRSMRRALADLIANGRRRILIDR